ncbi:MAG: type IV pili methyl-accepting chemotaxis transducer N-terminal domain-containing protein [Sulfurovaceae bacterium]|nr:type IV pili methyl-accepting chemotaxis transducer N-terminal domain-containing protein [Sulfurovaceae bacterium]
MKFKQVNHRGVIVMAMIISLSTSSFAKTNITDSQLINLAGKQRMLSQRIAKDYLYIGKNIATTKASKQLKESMNTFLLAHRKLQSSVQDEEVRNLLAFVELSSDDFKDIASQKFTLDNAQLILDLSESMLEGSQYVFASLQNSFKLKESSLIDKSTQQRMLSQRIAKYYISYQSGIKDKNSVKMMRETVKQFSINLEILMKNPSNTPKITKKLVKIEKLWKIVHKFYNNIEKGGLPLIVFNTTDNITKKMDEITKMYLMSHK